MRDLSLLPKAHLHLHFTGSMRHATLLELAAQLGSDVPFALVGGTALGTVAGDLLDPEAIGLDAAFPALFLALLAPYLRTRRALAAAVVAASITLVLLPLTPPGTPIVAASLAALLGLRR